MFDGMNIKSLSLEIEILSDQKQILGIVKSTEKALHPKGAREFQAWRKQYGIAWSTIFLIVERSLLQLNDVWNDAKALRDQLNKD